MFANDIIRAIRTHSIPRIDLSIPEASTLAIQPDTSTRDQLLALLQRKSHGLHVQHFPHLDITIFGTGEIIGDKAKELLLKTQAIRQAGLYTPPRLILTHDLLNGNWLHLLNQVVPFILKNFGTGPLIVRSSGAGDARGVGIYESHVVPGNQKMIFKAIRRILQSYRSEKAIAYQKKLNLDPQNYGLIIEPLLAQVEKVDKDYTNDGRTVPVTSLTAPISGHGYTSGPQGEGYQIVVPGLGCAVYMRFGEKITRRLLEPFGGNLDDYIGENRYHQQPSGLRHSQDLRGHYYNPLVWSNDGKALQESDYFFWDRSIFLNDLFDGLEKLKNRFGPQYVEWVCLTEENRATFYVVQIADIDIRIDFHLTIPENIKIEAINPVGHGQKNVSTIYYLQDDIYALRQFNATHPEGYILVCPITVSSLRGAQANLDLATISNAVAILEYGHGHTSEVYGHWRGLLENTGIFFGVVDERKTPLPEKIDEAPYKNFTEKGNFRVICSERDRRLVVCMV